MRCWITLAVLSLPAGALPPERSVPELEAKGIHATHGFCATGAYRTTIEVPSVPIPADPHVPEDYKKTLRGRTNAGRERLFAARRLTARIRRSVDDVVTTTNECPDGVWQGLEALTKAGEGAARDVAETELAKWLPKDRKIEWSFDPVPPQGPAADAASGDRFADSCRVPELDDVLFAPEAPGLPPAARAKLAGVAADAAAVVRALRGEKAAVDELARLSGGARCREILKAFDDLVARQRAMFSDYREKAVAGAVWDELSWKKVAVPPK